MPLLCWLGAGLSRADQAEDEAAIREMVGSYTAAFNKRDAKTVAAHWLPEAVCFDPDTRKQIVGRDAIAKHYVPNRLDVHRVAAVGTPWRDFRANLRPIGILAVGLVLVTTIGVAAAANFFIHLPWAVAFVLGTIVAPSDVIAVTAIAERLPIPSRTFIIFTGEGLANGRLRGLP
jgi:Sodium/hydrogen exchanger family/SnoaL-like domain